MSIGINIISRQLFSLWVFLSQDAPKRMWRRSKGARVKYRCEISSLVRFMRWGCWQGLQRRGGNSWQKYSRNRVHLWRCRRAGWTASTAHAFVCTDVWPFRDAPHVDQTRRAKTRGCTPSRKGWKNPLPQPGCSRYLIQKMNKLSCMNRIYQWSRFWYQWADSDF